MSKDQNQTRAYSKGEFNSNTKYTQTLPADCESSFEMNIVETSASYRRCSPSATQAFPQFVAFGRRDRENEIVRPD